MKGKLFTLAAAMMLLSLAASAQNMKIGYVQVEYLLVNMPDYKQANTQLEEYRTQLSSRLQSKMTDFQTKLADYQQTAQGLDAVTRQDKETELKNLDTQIQQFQANAEQSIAEKTQSLFSPIEQKLKETIDQVAAEQGYTHVFALGSALVYVKDESTNITPLVAQKLGFTLPE